MRLVLLAAVARNRAIGMNNTLPWHLPEDLKRFKSLTTDQTVAMGRKTFDSIVDRLGKPLPNRKSLVLTQNPAWKYADSADVSVIRSVGELSQVEAETIFVIGGAQIYEKTISAAQELDITEVDLDIPGADAFFPAIDETQWEKEAGDWQVSEKGIRFRFATYRRKT